jgi:D-alanyl-D-alanine carboxypeptidase (penicillin-binding protein 5/6)
MSRRGKAALGVGEGRRRHGRLATALALLALLGGSAGVAYLVGQSLLETSTPRVPKRVLQQGGVLAELFPGEARIAHGGGDTNPYELRPIKPSPVEFHFKEPPAAGVLFDVQSGAVLWQRDADLKLPIASLTKMMTAIVIAQNHRPAERVLITGQAVRTPGSGVGVLPRGKQVPLESMLYGLMLVSGNDAAVALAQHDAGSVAEFARRMNLQARQLGLLCSRFNSPHGLLDRGNHSCAADLGALARAILASPRLAPIVGARRAKFPFPSRIGTLELANNNPFLQQGAPGIPRAAFTGVKTGLTAEAGRSYVITARRRGRHLGVVLLDSPDPLRQVPALLRAGFRL